MNRKTQTAVARAEKAVSRLVEHCQKGGPLHTQNPKLVAQVSRTGKWHLNAIAGLKQSLGMSGQHATCSSI
jgi:hypothetical protein